MADYLPFSNFLISHLWRYCDSKHNHSASTTTPYISELIQSELPNGFKYKKCLSCAGFAPGGRTTCFSDSGGPVLLTKDTSSGDIPKVLHYVQVGTVQGSYNVDCSSSGKYHGYPVIFNRLENPSIFEFIRRKTDLSGLYKSDENENREKGWTLQQAKKLHLRTC